MNLIKFNCEVCKSKIRASIPYLSMLKVKIDILTEGLENRKMPPSRSSRSQLNTEKESRP